jgi:hypothetical protein
MFIRYSGSMKTNITMESVKDRELFGVVIRQETKTGFMSLTDLQEAYIHARVLNGWSDKHLTEVFRDTDNVERIYYVLNEQGFIKSQFSEFMEMVEEEGIIKVLKQSGAYRTTGRGENKRVMCNPYVWVLVAMELNPQLYAKVVTWLTDKLILNRIEAGNFYKTLSGALNRIPSPDYKRIAIELNKKVFGRHEVGIRNTAGKEELEELARLEDRIAFAIERGYVKTNDAIVDAIRG